MTRTNRVIESCCFLLYLWSSVNLIAEELTIAVATNFLTTAEELIKQFEEDSDIEVTVVAGSSGQLFAQVKNGAPYDVIFSADQDKIEAIVKENLGIKDSRITYALGRLCFMLNPKSASNQKALEQFENLEFNAIVIANPKLAPYGVAAEEVFDTLKVDLSTVNKKVIFADNVGKAYAIAKTGNADAGMVALSSVLDDELSDEYYYILPAKYYNPIRQDAIILSRTKNETNAREFLNFVQSDDAKTTIQSNGYELD